MKTDRRVQRTRELLQEALIELTGERRYDAITVQDIVDRANVGRTTFYLHFPSKDDLFVSCHEAIVSQFHSGALYPQLHTREALLSQDAPPEMIATYRHLQEVWGRLNSIFQSRDGPLIMRRVRNSNAQAIKGNLRAAFAKLDSRIPFDLLANYLAGAQIALLQWWLEQRVPYSPEDIAQAFHRLQRAAIRDAFGLLDRS